MININTLNELNEYGFGADIDRLESYIYNSKQSKYISRQENFEFNYLKLSKILRELKPESVVFTDKNFIKEDECSKYRNTILNNSDIHYDIAYGVQDDIINNFEVSENFTTNNDIVAIPNIDGIHMSCIYTNGVLNNVYIIGEAQVYNDITSIVKDVVPSKIEQLVHYNLVDCRAVLTIFTDKCEYNNIACEVVKCIRNNDTSILDIIFYDMFIHGESPYNNMWDKIEYMHDIGMNTPHHALIRDIQYGELKDACRKLYDYFKDINNSNGIVYKYSGIIIVINSIIEGYSNNNGFIYDGDDSKSTQLYKSIIRSINIEYKDKIYVVLNIVPVKTNDNNSIDKIEIHDISLLKTYKLYIGNPILFYVAEGKAILAKKHNDIH